MRRDFEDLFAVLAVSSLILLWACLMALGVCAVVWVFLGA